jgi:thiol:disulfide interchange protein DsbA
VGVKFRTLTWAAALVVAGTAQSQELQEGVDYNLISPAQPTSSPATQVEVAEFFQYSCPACYAFEPHLNAWLADGKPESVNFVRVHIVWNPLARMHAQAYFTAEALGKSAEMHAAFFEEFHVKGNMLDTEDKLAAFFGRFGVTREAFDNAFGSFGVHTSLQRADQLARRYRISGTPELVVNGKYGTDVTMAGSYTKFFENVNKLVATEQAEP